MKEFRLLEHNDADGITNMAIDESLFINYKKYRIPTLRIYGWNPLAISVGRFQKIEGLFKNDMTNYTIVRRITGGGAIIHHNEITYSIVCSTQDLGIDKVEVKKGFKILTDFLIRTYKNFHLNANYAISEYSEKLGIKSKLCFAAKEEYDIVIDRKKIGGNAQKRGKDIIFQHGSIPIKIDFELFYKIFNESFTPNKNSITFLLNHITEKDIINFKELLKYNFEKSLNIRLIKEQLTKEENYTKNILIKEKYSNKEWNLYGKETRMA